MKIYFIYDPINDKLCNIGKKGYAGYKSRKTAESYLEQARLWAYTIVEGKREYFKQSKDDYKVVEVEIK